MPPEPARHSLDGEGWRFRGFLGDEWRWERLGELHDDWWPGHVPGSVIDDLVRAGELADPRWERNSLAAEWVHQRSWAYQRGFTADPAWRALHGDETRVELVFDGIDPGGRVVLNGRPLGSHDGMFVAAEWDATGRLRWGRENVLAVVLAPAPELPSQVGDTRRALHHRSRMGYGWDFCPRLVHQGIWDSVSLRVTGAVRIEQAFARPTLDDNRATVTVTAELDTRIGGVVDVTARLLRRDVLVARAGAAIAANPGRTPMAVTLDIPNARLWWPNGQGEPTLYRLELDAFVDGRLSERLSTRIGLRRVELVPNEGAEPAARPYTVVVNGRRVYLTGWNWVPIDACYGVPRPDKLHHLLRLARDAHVNLLRVWGGGLIERAAFYDRCDELGIMVWQEFIQSSSSIVDRPSRRPAFVRRMASEAHRIVPRLRNHPSLVIWGGGNELADLDHRPLDDDEPVLSALAAVVRQVDPDRAWLPTSPTGRVPTLTAESVARDPGGLHDVHGPWEHQGLGRHEALYDADTSLVHSEFGVEGMANLATIEATIAPEHRWPADRSNPVYAHRGAWWNNAPLVQEAFGGGIDRLDELERASHYLQASGLAYAVEANRRRQWRSSGAMPWQLNEPFPNAWCTSAVDHAGRTKPAYHAVAAAYAPIALSARVETQAWAGRDAFSAELWIATSRPHAVSGTWQARLLDERGAVLARTADDLTPMEPGARRIGTLRAPLPADERVLVLDLELGDGSGAVLAARRYLFSSGPDLSALRRLPGTAIDASLTRGGVAVRNRGDLLAVLVRISDPRPLGADGWMVPSDDPVTLLPGEERLVRVVWRGVEPTRRTVRLQGWNTPEIVCG